MLFIHGVETRKQLIENVTENLLFAYFFLKSKKLLVKTDFESEEQCGLNKFTKSNYIFETVIRQKSKKIVIFGSTKQKIFVGKR